RIVHTIKGTCGFLGLPRLESVAHAAENMLGKFRDGEMKVSPAGVTLILAALDRIKMLLAALEATEAEPIGDDGELIARINAMVEGRGPAPGDGMTVVGEVVAAGELEAGDPVTTEAADTVAVALPAPAQSASGQNEVQAADSGVAAQSIRVHVDLLEDLMTMVSELVLTRNQLLQILRTQKDSEFATPLQ